MRPDLLLGAALLWCLILGLSAAAPAGDLNSREEAGLFSLAELGTVDLAPKAVTVEVYVGPGPELDACRRLLPLAMSRAQQFYAQMGVMLKETPGSEQPGALSPGKRLRVEVLTDKQWLDRSFKAFDVAPPFRLRFLQVCKDKCAFAHLPLSTVHISFKRFREAEAGPGDVRQNENWFANLLIHELGHLMGLYHAHEFTNDPVARAVKNGGAANFMSQDIAFKATLSFAEFQKLQLHSYLGGGKVFRQYQQVNFDPLRYLEVVKRVNGYRETSPRKVTKISYSFSKKIKTFDDDDDDDDDD